MPLASGSQLGPYEILSFLGGGGMGQVYRAHDPRLNREVAIKVLSPQLSADPRALDMFQSEAKLVASLSHANILSIHDLGSQGGVSFAVMELLEGETLRQRMSRLRLPLSDVLPIGICIADGLAAAHSKGIVHRDIKPENVFLTSDGSVKILDFGLAQVSRNATDGRLLIGSPGYMSPELFRGLPATPSCDIFSLGCVLYEMIANQNPFLRDSTVATMAATLNYAPPHVNDAGARVPAPLNSTIMRCLEKNPAARFQSASDLALTLRAISLPGGAVPQVSPNSLGRRAMLAGSIVLAAAAVWAYFKFPWRSEIASIAVLPFTNTSADPSTSYISAGMTEGLIGDLARLHGLRVLALSTVYRYKGAADHPRKVGKDLNVRALLVGRISQNGGTLDITAELVDTRDGSQLWGHHYRRNSTEFFDIQQQISREVLAELRPGANSPEMARLKKRRSENPEVYNLYLRGRYEWNKRTQESIKRGIEYFKQAQQLDPGSALPYAGLADSYMFQSAELPPRQIFPMAEAAARRAIELDDTLAEPHVALEYINLQYNWDWQATEREYRKAIERNPNYAMARSVYARYLAAMARFPEAEKESRAALQLDPLSFSMSAGLGRGFYLARQFDRARKQYQSILDLDPEYSLALIGLAETLAEMHQYDEAREMISKMAKGAPVTGAGMLSRLGYIYGASGKVSQTNAILAQLAEIAKHTYVSPDYFVTVYAAMGEKDLALDKLEQAYSDRSWFMNVLKVDPRVDNLRSERRFADLLYRVGLP